MNWSIISLATLLLLSSYMLLAVTFDLFAHLEGRRQVGGPAVYFGAGYGIFGGAFLSALLLIYLCSLPRVYPKSPGNFKERA